VPFASVNDDFCDCSDGSDEPGSGACSGQEDTLFYCANAGSSSQLVYSSRVGDGICDCCDGSDEAQLMKRRPHGTTVCTDTCVQEGQKLKAEREQKLKELREGLQVKQTAIEEAKTKRTEQQAEIQRLQGELPSLEASLEELRKKKEAADAVKLQAECITELPKLRETVKTMQAKIDSLEAELKTLKGDTTSTTTKKVISEYTKWMDGAEAAVEEDDVDSAEEEAPVEVKEIPLGEKPKEEEEDALSKELKEMEAKVKSHKDSKSSLEKKLQELPEDRLGFVALQDKCLEYQTSEYTYKLCFFKDAKQGHTTLGRWEGFGSPLEAKFTNGDMCYGGPARSLIVNFECGAEEAVLDMNEPSRCTYQATVKHPGACDSSMEADLQKPPTKHPKDEL